VDGFSVEGVIFTGETWKKWASTVAVSEREGDRLGGEKGGGKRLRTWRPSQARASFPSGGAKCTGKSGLQEEGGGKNSSRKT